MRCLSKPGHHGDPNLNVNWTFSGRSGKMPFVRLKLLCTAEQHMSVCAFLIFQPASPEKEPQRWWVLIICRLRWKLMSVLEMSFMPHAHSGVLKLLGPTFSNQPIKMQHDSNIKHKPLTLGFNIAQIIVPNWPLFSTGTDKFKVIWLASQPVIEAPLASQSVSRCIRCACHSGLR